MLTIRPSAIEAIKVITPKTSSDTRGTFSETYNRDLYFAHGITLEFVQDNQSSSIEKGTIRGLHFQRYPAAQAKLVRVLRGRALDVAVDLRRSSPTYGNWVAEEISAASGNQLLVPVGFAHGFCTLEADTHVLYKVTRAYSPEHEVGIAWDDPELAIDWPSPPGEAVLSEKDAGLPSFKSLARYFE